MGIGYGGANVRGNDQKLFHAVNGMASQMGPNNIPGWLVRFFVDWAFASSPFPKMIDNQTSSINLTDEIRENVTKRWGDWIEKEDDSKILGAIAFEKKEHWKQVIKGIMLLVFGMLTFILLYDPNKNGHLEAFYATLISATTVGYGDIAPSSNWAKVISAFVLPVLTAVFADFFGTELVGGGSKLSEQLNCDLSGWKDDFIADLERENEATATESGEAHIHEPAKAIAGFENLAAFVTEMSDLNAEIGKSEGKKG